MYIIEYQCDFAHISFAGNLPINTKTTISRL